MITFCIFIAQIPFKYCQRCTEKHILIIYTFPKGMKKMNFAPKRPKGFKISKNGFCYFFFKVPSFVYLRLLLKRLRRIKVRVVKNLEDFSIETFIHIHIHIHSYSFIHIHSKFCSTLTIIRYRPSVDETVIGAECCAQGRACLLLRTLDAIAD